MKALLIATGEREKLHPLTTRHATPMLPVANRPVITYAIELMIRHQFRDILVSLLRQPDSIEVYCGTGRRWNVDLTYLLQREALGIAGSIKRAQHLLTDTFLLMPGDALVDVNLTELYEFHRAHGGVATAVLSTNSDGKAGMQVAQLDSTSRICSVQSNASLSDALCFTNVFIFEPEVLEFIPNQRVFDCQTDLFQRLLAEDKAVYGYVMQGYWNPLDSFADYQSAQQDYLRSLTNDRDVEPSHVHLRHPYVEAGDNGDRIWRGQGVTIHPSAQINAPVLIGAGSQIGRNTTIGPDVIIGPSSIVDDGATIEYSTILPDTYIGKLVKVHKKLVSASTLIDIESETSIEIPDRTLLGSAGIQTANALLRSILERLTALSMVIFAMPFLVTIALLTWLAGSGSVIVQESRIGRSLTNTPWQGEAESMIIRLYHLRTRLDNGSYTLLGQWLEKWEVHRLPELFNVFRGDLAFVGVKPLTEEEASLITEVWQRRRFDCPSGFTGRWYTEVNSDGCTDDLFVADAYQTAMQSIHDSVQQLIRTPAAWWHRRKVVARSTNHKNTHTLIQSRLPRSINDNPIK